MLGKPGSLRRSRDDMLHNSSRYWDKHSQGRDLHKLLRDRCDGEHEGTRAKTATRRQLKTVQVYQSSMESCQDYISELPYSVDESSSCHVLFGALQTGFSNRKVLDASYEASMWHTCLDHTGRVRPEVCRWQKDYRCRFAGPAGGSDLIAQGAGREL